MNEHKNENAIENEMIEEVVAMNKTKKEDVMIPQLPPAPSPNIPEEIEPTLVIDDEGTKVFTLDDLPQFEYLRYTRPSIGPIYFTTGEEKTNGLTYRNRWATGLVGWDLMRYFKSAQRRRNDGADRAAVTIVIDGTLYALTGTGENPSSLWAPVVKIGPKLVPWPVARVLGEEALHLPTTRWLEVTSAWLNHLYVWNGSKWADRVDLLTGVADCRLTREGAIAIRRSVAKKLFVWRRRALTNVYPDPVVQVGSVVKAGEPVGYDIYTDQVESFPFNIRVRAINADGMVIEWVSPVLEGDKWINAFGHKGVIDIVDDNLMSCDILISSEYKRGLEAQLNRLNTTAEVLGHQVEAGVMPWYIMPENALSNSGSFLFKPKHEVGRYFGETLAPMQEYRLLKDLPHDPEFEQLPDYDKANIKKIAADPIRNLFYPVPHMRPLREYPQMLAFISRASNFDLATGEIRKGELPNILFNKNRYISSWLEVGEEEYAAMKEHGATGEEEGHWVQCESTDFFGMGRALNHYFLPFMGRAVRYTNADGNRVYALHPFAVLAWRLSNAEGQDKHDLIREWGMVMRRAAWELILGTNKLGERYYKPRVLGLHAEVIAHSIPDDSIWIPRHLAEGLEEGELVLVIRRPVACWNEMRILRVRKYDGLTVRINGAILKRMGGDCDGDMLTVLKMRAPMALSLLSYMRMHKGWWEEPTTQPFEGFDRKKYLAFCEIRKPVKYIQVVRSKIDLKFFMGISVTAAWEYRGNYNLAQQSAELVYQIVDKYNFNTNRGQIINQIRARLPKVPGIDYDKLEPDIRLGMRNGKWARVTTIDQVPKTIEEIERALLYLWSNLHGVPNDALKHFTKEEVEMYESVLREATQ